MKRVGIFATALLAACSPSPRNAAIVLYDQSYAVEIVLDQEDGITSPDGLWWDEGVLYIADEGGSAIRRWDGKTLETLADASSGIASPEDLVVDPAGQVWFTDDTAGGLWRVTRIGAERLAGTQGIAESEGIALRDAGLLWVGDGKSGRVAAVYSDGRGTQPVAGDWRVAKPETMALSPGGGLWLADNREDRLLRIDTAGTAREWPLPADLSPESIAVDGESLWITDSHNGRLYRLHRGQKLETVALFLADLHNVNGIAVTEAGTVYVSVQSNLANGEGYVVRLTPAADRKSSR